MDKEAILDRVTEHLTEHNMHFRTDEERGIIRFGLNINCKLRNLEMILIPRASGLSVYAICPIKADATCVDEVMRYIIRANYGLINGNFEMDLNDGEIRYRMYACVDGFDSLPDEQIKRCIILPVRMYERYGDGLAALLMGFSDAETEIKRAESE